MALPSVLTRTAKRGLCRVELLTLRLICVVGSGRDRRGRGPAERARIFGWRIPERTDPAIYFGRCLGAFIRIAELLMLRAVLTG